VSTVKVSELPVLSSADAADEFVVVDDSAGVTKKITFDSLATDVRTESEPLTATTVTASGLVTASSGITFGADTLDDYEEGTWTPTLLIGGSEGTTTYTARRGGYVKIGRFVHANFRVTLGTRDTGLSGAINISNFPFLFSMTNVGDAYGVAARRVLGIDKNSDEELFIGGGFNQTQISFRLFNDTKTDRGVDELDIDNNFSIEASISYMTDS